jgi:hypothetical protein
VGVAILLGSLASARAARADERLDSASTSESASNDRARPRWSLGLLAGSTWFDSRLADYQWDLRPRLAWGLRALAEVGRFGWGIEVARSHAVQRTGLGDPASDPAVRATRIEWVGESRLASRAGATLLVTAAVGRLHLGYDPDRVAFSSGGGTTVVVDFRPIDEWEGGGGLALRRGLGGPLALGLEVDRRFFALETARRNGTTIETGRESFAEWNARLELSRAFGRH